MLLVLTQCETNTPKSDFCLIYQPVFWHELDESKMPEVEKVKIENIRTQIDGNNLAFDIMCLKGE